MRIGKNLLYQSFVKNIIKWFIVPVALFIKESWKKSVTNQKKKGVEGRENALEPQE